MKSKAHETLKLMTAAAFDKLLVEKIDPWWTFKIKHVLHVTKYDGKEINYQGIGFSGSPHEVFWGNYIEPFIKNIAVELCDKALEICERRALNTNEVFDDLTNFLVQHCSKVYRRMRRISPRNIDDKMTITTQELINITSEYKYNKEAPVLSVWTRATLFYKEHSLLFWILGAAISIVGLFAAA